MTDQELETREQICKQCEFCVYEVYPNFDVCKQTTDIAIKIVITRPACPIGKW